MPVRVAINGFGRIGRQVLRQVARRHADIEVVVVNSAGARAEMCAHLLKYDSVFGRYDGEVCSDGDHLIVEGRPIRISDQADPLLCPWHAFDVDVVVEATGRFTDRDEAARHLQAGARKVIITAPARYEDATLVVGVSDAIYDAARHHVVSAASCTTNCLAPVLKVLHEAFGVAGALMTTIHAYTRDQELLDGSHPDLRRARAANLNMTPTKTGAARAIDKVFPELAGRVVGLAVRVPIPDVSLVDLTATLDLPATVDDVNRVFREAAAGTLGAVLGASDEPLVSTDFHGDTRSAVVDLASTRGGPGNTVKVLAWYDNEAGYAARVIDLCRLLGAAGRSTGGNGQVARVTPRPASN
ncbi:MAG TPA: type I glyceraldehyde-3-phosphate dehydrogenase [Acidimicrobiia bacterium]|nr:type I glyceraldehyde-3-phosphate dehydrogenase [Acidimicrobiia bacterium]